MSLQRIYKKLQQIDIMTQNIDKKWVCYILKSINPSFPNHTYNGATNNIHRRIRQHNGLIEGGAKQTRQYGTSEMYCVITGFPNKTYALSCEWWIKHPTGARTRPPPLTGIIGRIQGLNHLILKSNKWISKFGHLPLTIFITEEYKSHLSPNLPPTITIKTLTSLTDISHD